MFKIGDRVVCINDGSITGSIIFNDDDECFPYLVDRDDGTKEWYHESELRFAEPPESSEVRVTDPKTGGQKGKKPEEYAFIPSGALAEVARVYGMGAEKYEPWNWAKGYPWSLSFSALFRHIEAFRGGQSLDPDSGLSHLAHAAFHLFTLMEFENHELGTDDRWTP